MTWGWTRRWCSLIVRTIRWMACLLLHWGGWLICYRTNVFAIRVLWFGFCTDRAAYWWLASLMNVLGTGWFRTTLHTLLDWFNHSCRTTSLVTFLEKRFEDILTVLSIVQRIFVLFNELRCLIIRIYYDMLATGSRAIHQLTRESIFGRWAW